MAPFGKDVHEEGSSKRKKMVNIRILFYLFSFSLSLCSWNLYLNRSFDEKGILGGNNWLILVIHWVSVYTNYERLVEIMLQIRYNR